MSSAIAWGAGWEPTGIVATTVFVGREISVTSLPNWLATNTELLTGSTSTASGPSPTGIAMAVSAWGTDPGSGRADPVGATAVPSANVPAAPPPAARRPETPTRADEPRRRRATTTTPPANLVPIHAPPCLDTVTPLGSFDGNPADVRLPEADARDRAREPGRDRALDRAEGRFVRRGYRESDRDREGRSGDHD